LVIEEADTGTMQGATAVGVVHDDAVENQFGIGFHQIDDDPSVRATDVVRGIRVGFGRATPAA
jgi:hypothetical protein